VTRRLIRAVLETSFWTAAHRADVAANCFDLFEIVVPRAVEREILRPEAAPREFPYSTLFRQFRERFRDPPPDAPPPLRMFGPGEAEAIPLALHLSADLLMNEHRAARFAEARGVWVVTAPMVIAMLYRLGVISWRAADRKLDLVKPITSPAILERGRRLLAELQAD